MMQSGIMRDVDLRYPSNLLALGLATAAGCVALLRGLADEKAILVTFIGAVISGVAVFMAWAMTRELDPDHAGAAGLAGLLALVGMQVVEPKAAMLILVAILLMLRSIAGTTGISLKWFDYAAIGFWWGMGLVFLLATSRAAVQLNFSLLLGMVSVALFCLYAAWGVPQNLISVTDRTQQPLERRRIQGALYAAGGVVAVMLVLGFAEIILPLMVVSYALWGYAIYLTIEIKNLSIKDS